MARVLFITVGTGIGSDRDKKVYDLAHGLLTAIEHYKPDRIVLFGSAESEATVTAVQAQFQEKHGQPLTNVDFVRITQIDDFEHCFEHVKRKIQEHAGDEVIIDYTSGTKTMTMTAALASMLYHKKLSLVTGKRGESGLVVPGTEKIQEQNLYSAYDIELETRLKVLFNLHQFEAAGDLLPQIISLSAEAKNRYATIIDACGAWDRFHHEIAFEKLKPLKDTAFAPNKEFLGKLKNAPESTKRSFLIADLLNNARRRITEAKDDDAVARLYRAVELIAQHVLADRYNISTGDVNLDELKARGFPEHLGAKYAAGRDEKGKVKLALQKDYELLMNLGDPLGARFNTDRELADLLRKRNDSILAHGLVPVEKAGAERLLAITEQYGRSEIPNLPELMAKSTFPVL